jgi:hypothetical protein
LITSKRKERALLNGEIPSHLAFLSLVDFEERDGVVVVELTDETREALEKQWQDRLVERDVGRLIPPIPKEVEG